MGQEQIKEAIEELEKLFLDILWDDIGEDFKRRADNILAILRPLAEKPEAREFTKKFKVLLYTQDKTAIVQEGYDACDIIDRQAAELKKLRESGYVRHKHNCYMDEYNSILIGKGCNCGLSDVLKEK